jgi:hypothetical protein
LAAAGEEVVVVLTPEVWLQFVVCQLGWFKVEAPRKNPYPGFGSGWRRLTPAGAVDWARVLICERVGVVGVVHNVNGRNGWDGEHHPTKPHMTPPRTHQRFRREAV